MTRQILEAKHMKRALEAHITTIQALYDLYVEEFFLEYPHLLGPCTDSAQQVNKSYTVYVQQELKEQQAMLATLESNNVLEAMAKFDEERKNLQVCAALHADGVSHIHIHSFHP